MLMALTCDANVRTSVAYINLLLLLWGLKMFVICLCSLDLDYKCFSIKNASVFKISFPFLVVQTATVSRNESSSNEE